MEGRNETNTGVLGWMGVGAAVLAAEVLCEESLTHAFRRGLDSDRCRPYVLGGLALTNLHLLGMLPRHIDPFVGLEKVGKLGLEAYRRVT